MQTVEVGDAKIPLLGFGVYRMSGVEVQTMVPHALEAGFRHFDTAQFYNNEADLGRSLETAGVSRNELFITTKIWVDNYSRERFAASVDESLEKLRMDHVDLLLLHWPSTKVPLDQQIAQLDAARAAGKTRHIGVSNFNLALVEEAKKLAHAPIVTNQVEFHPFLDQSTLLAGLRRMGVAATGYYGMADGEVLTNPVIRGIAERHGKTPAQVGLRWIIQQGVVALSKTASPSRAAENADIFDFELHQEEMQQIHALARPDGRKVDPKGLAPDWDH
jgi:2,5-diketo-D-gluconate reductase B